MPDRQESQVFIVLPVTLFETLPISSKSSVVIIEHPVYFGKLDKNSFSFSKPKLAYTKATLLAYQAHLASKNIDFKYVSLSSYKSFRASLRTCHVTCFDPVDKIVVTDLQNAAKSMTVLEAPNFLTSEADMKWYVDHKPNRDYFHKHFYEWQRKRTGILMHNGKPIGGKYSYDPENRKPLPKGHVAPLPPRLTDEDYAFWQQATEWVEKNFPKAPGVLRDDALKFPVTHKGARIWLKQFLKVRLSLFGQYEDAIAQHQPLLYHSGCSPMLLVGLLTPQEILSGVLERFANGAPLEAVEGFYRQLIWREWTYMLYVYESESMFKSNYLRATRKLNKCWYDGTTGIPPVDDAIKDAFTNGYLHHIQRLMICGAVMQMCHVHPHDIFRWFLEFSVDSNQMLMVFNTLSMVSFATGPKYTTKPYNGSSAYTLRMSNYSRGPWCDVWDALYYEFWKKHYNKLKSVRQGQFAMGNLSRKSKQQQQDMSRIARQFIRKVTSP